MSKPSLAPPKPIHERKPFIDHSFDGCNNVLPTDPLLNSSAAACRRMACRRAFLDGEHISEDGCPGLSNPPSALRTLLKDLHPTHSHGGEEKELDRLLAEVASSPSWRQPVEPYFRTAWRRHNAATSARKANRVAIMIIGAVRSMLEPVHLVEFGDFFATLRRTRGEDDVRTFAYLAASYERNCLSRVSRQPAHAQGSQLEQAAGPLLDKANTESCGHRRHHHADSVVLGARIRAAFDRFGVAIDLEWHDAGNTLMPLGLAGICPCPAGAAERLHDIETGGTGGYECYFFMMDPRCVSVTASGDTLHDSNMMQYLKASAALAMVTRHEARVGAHFDLVLKIRPDICMHSAAHLLQFAIRRSDELQYPVAFFARDGLAVLPRWMAEAYAEAWRTHADGCQLPHSWYGEGARLGGCAVLRSRRRPPSGAPTHFFWIAAGLIGIDVHQLWRRTKPGFKSSNRTRLVLLRRSRAFYPAQGCVEWS